MKHDDEEIDTTKHEEAEDSDESEDDLETAMETGQRDADVYSKAGREKLEEDDELDPEEAGFSKGEEMTHKKRKKSRAKGKQKK